ncbi:PD-(D/E)XK nuclease superfamily protein [Bacteroides luti]|uniref:PD-(D/E)XK nuclease superfamily protein n=1 Tax=Bacteroides luti TaxID=1297750 RepID=A0A1M5EMI6_9BACE|nr:PD-(D/E)XK nuclease family protein [Bacteroides luti]SHF80417.1 PD-(D/E)XK nuclease superfamily protein [Bacteroides luti]
MSNFFNRIGLADMEKMHSAIIGWIFSDENKAFTKKEKSSILNSLFYQKSSEESLVEYNEINVLVETDNIDILFLLEDVSGNKKVIIVENKIKSSQHSDQLKKYQSIVKKKYPEHNQKRYIFLTYSNEEAKCDNKEIDSESWTEVTYDKIHDKLRSVLQPKLYADAIILDEYLKSIESFITIKNKFLKDHTSFTSVFTDASKKKSVKQNEEKDSDDAKFISENQLETILQKMLIQDIAKNVSFGTHKFNISETHGKAQISIFLGSNLDSTDSENEKIYFDFSFQDGSFKIAISKNYSGSEEEQRQGFKIIENNWKPIMEKYYKEFNYKRFNNSKGKKPRISISQKIESEWYKLKKEKLIDLFQEKFDEAIEIKKELENRYNKERIQKQIMPDSGLAISIACNNLQEN